MYDRYFIFSYNHTAYLFLMAYIYDTLNIVFSNRMYAHVTFTNKAIGTIVGHIAINKRCYLPQVVNKQKGSTRRYINLHTIGFSTFQRFYCRSRYGVRFKTYQCSVNIEE